MAIFIIPLAVPEVPSVEIVERKGSGHPDTLCDAVAEAASSALSRYYREHFGRILHYNVDKALLCAGASRPAFGGGRITEPLDLFLAGRATSEYQGQRIPVEEIVREAAKSCFTGFEALDFERGVRFHCLVRPGVRGLQALVDRQLANDTSVGVGFAPYSSLEALVLATDRHLDALRAKHPEIGLDTKIMAVKRGWRVDITLACAFVDRHVADLAAYDATKAMLVFELGRMIDLFGLETGAVAVNGADSGEDVYLTVSGTSAEAGDDGQVGRGNRVSGLITPCRPMSLEATAGKNPVAHVGKLYNLAATRIAEAIVEEVPGAEAAECAMVSLIGRPLREPRTIEVAVRGTYDEAKVRAVVQRSLEQIENYWKA